MGSYFSVSTYLFLDHRDFLCIDMTSVDPAYSKLENSVDGFIYIVIVVFIIHVIKHV